MGPPSRSFAADAYDCIMVRIRIGSTEYKCVARCSAPNGELPSDHHADTDKAASDAGASKKGPSRCSSSLRVLSRQGAAKHKLSYDGTPPSAARISVPSLLASAPD